MKQRNPFPVRPEPEYPSGGIYAAVLSAILTMAFIGALIFVSTMGVYVLISIARQP